MMSRQSKQVKTYALARQITAEHKSGNRRPARTATARKTSGYRKNPERMKRLAEFVANMKRMVR